MQRQENAKLHFNNKSIEASRENASGDRDGVAVAALGGAGVGVHASGARAAIVLEPHSTKGAPTIGFHSMGEMLVDSQGDLVLCKASGTPGTWGLVA